MFISWVQKYLGKAPQNWPILGGIFKHLVPVHKASVFEVGIIRSKVQEKDFFSFFILFFYLTLKKGVTNLWSIELTCTFCVIRCAVNLLELTDAWKNKVFPLLVVWFRILSKSSFAQITNKTQYLLDFQLQFSSLFLTKLVVLGLWRLFNKSEKVKLTYRVVKHWPSSGREQHFYLSKSAE